MGGTSESQEFHELIERSSLGTASARSLRSRIPRSQAKLVAQIIDHREKLAACRKAGDHNGAIRALSDLADAYLALGNGRAALGLAQETMQEALAAATRLQATAEKDAAAIRVAAEQEAADLRTAAKRERDEIIAVAIKDATSLKRTRPLGDDGRHWTEVAERRTAIQRMPAGPRAFGELEVAIMDVMWAAESPCVVREVRERLDYDRPVAYTTVMTVMNLLHRKGVLHRAKLGRAWQYWPVERREDHDARLMTEVLHSGGDEDVVIQRFLKLIRQEHDEPERTPDVRSGL